MNIIKIVFKGAPNGNDNAAGSHNYPSGRASVSGDGSHKSSTSPWTGTIDSDLKLDTETHAQVQKTMGELASSYPSLAGINVRRGGFLKGTDTLATKDKSSIALNPDKWENPASLKQWAKDWDGMVADPSVHGIIVHEAGHILDGQAMESLGVKKYNAVLKKHFIDPSSISNEHTTPYGQEHVSEAVAEAFSLHNQNKSGVTGFDASQRATAKALWNDLLKGKK